MISSIGGSMDYASMRDQMYTRADGNGDGTIDQSELDKMADKMSKMTGKSMDSEDFLSKFDTNNDGSLSKDEFNSAKPDGPPPWMSKLREGDMRGDSTQSFLDMITGSNNNSSDSTDELDKNGDGVVSADEESSALDSLLKQYQKQLSNYGNSPGLSSVGVFG